MKSGVRWVTEYKINSGFCAYPVAVSFYKSSCLTYKSVCFNPLLTLYKSLPNIPE